MTADIPLKDVWGRPLPRDVQPTGVTTDTPSLPAAQECWGLFDASGKLRAANPLDDTPLRAFKAERTDRLGWTILPGRFVPDDAKIAEKEAG